MSNTKRKPYCPVTFIGKETKTDEDLNGMFILPYKTKTLSDAFHATVFEEEVNRIKAEDPEFGVKKAANYGFDVFDASCNANSDAIISYLVMNATELTMSTLTQFVQEAFITVGAGMTVQFLPDVDDIRKIIIGSVQGYREPIDMNESQSYIYFDSIMDSIFAKVTSMVFDKVITDNVYKIANRDIPVIIDDENDTQASHNLLDTFYMALFTVCYNAPCDHIPEDVSTEITFCTSILRDIANDYLIQLRSGLTAMCVTLANMVAYSTVGFAPAIANNSTTAKKFIADNVAFESIIGPGADKLGMRKHD